MPQETANMVWRFDSPSLALEQGRDMAQAIERFGAPWVEQYLDLGSVVEALRDSVPWEYSQKRIPVALVLVGRHDAALRFVDDEVTKLADRDDEAASDFRAFAQSLREKLLASGASQP